MDINEAFETRRSASFFGSSKDVDESAVKEIYEMAKLAPSSFNLQPWKMILVHDPEQKKKLRECASDQPKVSEAAYTAIILGDRKAYEEMDPILDEFIGKGYFPEEARASLKDMGRNLYSGDNERAFASRNAGLFAMSFMLAAHSKGIATHPMDGIDMDAVREAFNIPERYDIVMLLAIGKFDESKSLLPRCKRKDFEEVIVRESF